MNKLNVILLKKNLAPIENLNNVDWVPYEHTHWVALGHFDDIYTYQINCDDGFLLSIKEDKMRVLQHNDDASYYHPLYLIPHLTTKVRDNTHWFIAVVRIHFFTSTEITAQFERILNYINGNITPENMPCQIYYATEFSDMVLDVRCNSLDSLLKFVLRIREFNQTNIGKTYTYFGINSHLLKSSKKFQDPDEVIDLFTVRFSGYNMDITGKQIELIQKHLGLDGGETSTKYCINGIDDIMLIFKNRHTKNIIDLYKTWLFDDSNKKYRKSESSTRVGIAINEDIALSEVQSNYEPVEYTLCDELPDLCKKISELIFVREDKQYFGWFYAISEIANSLVRMSKTPIMDEVVYLIAPGVKAFLLNVFYLLNYKSTEDYSCYGYLYKYVESCSYYIEQLVRVEGQLSHNPEIRPVIYDIPVFMLEYTIAFLNRVSNLLRKKDEYGEKKNTAILLVPCPCERTSATEVFPVSDNLPGLVHIQIPEDVLYAPAELFRSLCHEISHYVGETFRNRYDRKSAYIHAIASLFTNYIFKSSDELFFYMIKSIFQKALEGYVRPTIKEMHDVIINRASDLIYQDDCMNNIFYEYINYSAEQNMLPNIIEFKSDEDLQLIFHKDFEERVNDIDILFREVFADICMIHILGVNVDSYIDSLLYELIMYPMPSNISDETFAVRLYVTLTAMNKNIDYSGVYQTSSRWDDIKSHITKISEEIVYETNGKYKLPIPSNSIYALLRYAQKCFQTLSAFLTQSDMKEVRKMYGAFANDGFKYEDVLREIEYCRKEMLK